MKSKIEIFSKAKEYHRKGELDEAIKIYENLVKKDKDHQIYFFLGTAHLQKKKIIRKLSFILKVL